MEFRLKKINAKDTARVCGILYAFFGVLYLLGGVFTMGFGSVAVGIPFIIMGILFPVLGWVFVLLGTLVFNWVLKKTGGIQYIVEKKK